MKVGKGRNVQKLLYPEYKRNPEYMIGFKKISFNIPYTCGFWGSFSVQKCTSMKRCICCQFNSYGSLVPDVEKVLCGHGHCSFGEVVVSCPAWWFVWFILCTLSVVVCRTVTEIVDVFVILIL